MKLTAAERVKANRALQALDDIDRWCIADLPREAQLKVALILSERQPMASDRERRQAQTQTLRRQFLKLRTEAARLRSGH